MMNQKAEMLGDFKLFDMESCGTNVGLRMSQSRGIGILSERYALETSYRATVWSRGLKISVA